MEPPPPPRHNNNNNSNNWLRLQRNPATSPTNMWDPIGLRRPWEKDKQVRTIKKDIEQLNTASASLTLKICFYKDIVDGRN